MNTFVFFLIRIFVGCKHFAIIFWNTFSGHFNVRTFVIFQSHSRIVIASRDLVDSRFLTAAVRDKRELPVECPNRKVASALIEFNLHQSPLSFMQG